VKLFSFFLEEEAKSLSHSFIHYSGGENGLTEYPREDQLNIHEQINA
jgi:hypothetical protein